MAKTSTKSKVYPIEADNTPSYLKYLNPRLKYIKVGIDKEVYRLAHERSRLERRALGALVEEGLQRYLRSRVQINRIALLREQRVLKGEQK